MKYVRDLVSVVIPTYRRCDLLKRSLDSVLKQTYRKIECIVVNDNIPGDSYSIKLYGIIKEYANDDRFHFLEQEKHVNGAEARNCGIRYATGEYIAFLDDDDWWEIDKIEKQVAFMKSQDDTCGGVSTLVKFCKGNNVVRKSIAYKDGYICKEILRRQIDVTTCSVLLKRCCLDETGYFDNTLKRHQEIQLFAFFTSKYKIKLIKQYLTCVSFDDQQNNPSSENLICIKKDFFLSVNSIISEFSYIERKRIIALHMFELSYVFLKEKNYYGFLKYALKILRDPKTFCIAVKRVLNRKKETSRGISNE